MIIIVAYNTYHAVEHSINQTKEKTMANSNEFNKSAAYDNINEALQQAMSKIKYDDRGDEIYLITADQVIELVEKARVQINTILMNNGE